jgi:hypothetical protein
MVPSPALRSIPVTPAKAGVQNRKRCAAFLDFGLRRNDEFLAIYARSQKLA